MGIALAQTYIASANASQVIGWNIEQKDAGDRIGKPSPSFKSAEKMSEIAPAAGREARSAREAQTLGRRGVARERNNTRGAIMTNQPTVTRGSPGGPGGSNNTGGGSGGSSGGGSGDDADDEDEGPTEQEIDQMWEEYVMNYKDWCEDRGGKFDRKAMYIALDYHELPTDGSLCELPVLYKCPKGLNSTNQVALSLIGIGTGGLIMHFIAKGADKRNMEALNKRLEAAGLSDDEKAKVNAYANFKNRCYRKAVY